jgi:hypothetical protein
MAGCLIDEFRAVLLEMLEIDAPPPKIKKYTYNFEMVHSIDLGI